MGLSARVCIIWCIIIGGLITGCGRPKPLDPFLRDKIQAAFNAAGIEYDVGRVRTVAWHDALWNALNRDVYGSAFVYGETIHHSAQFYTGWRGRLGHRQVWAHEVYHCYQYHVSTKGAAPLAIEFVREGLKQIHAGRSWSDQVLEREATEFSYTVE